YHEKKLGQLFCDNKSSDILGMLLDECIQVGVSMHLDTSIQEIAKVDSGYQLQTPCNAALARLPTLPQQPQLRRCRKCNCPLRLFN
ncbi:NAD(P)/FAD-dependent oxidoreductase, partial [Klebsiella pneumoniae]